MTTRRELLRKSVLGAGIGALVVGSSSSLANVCLGLTPDQTEGPFYPISEQLDSDNDLTFVKDNSVHAEGEVIYLAGVVTDGDCKPVKGALVEVWQACKSGKYNHPGDPNPAALDPNFQYFGRSLTNDAGEYLFKTIRPGAYPAASNWMRPSHIHVKVHVMGFEELTTQMYFKDDQWNDKDLILQSLPLAERNRVIVDFSQDKKDDKPLGRFDIRIKKVVGAI
jgi:protocatechuate 3,4-dioxygenase, beta subunit